MCFEKQEGQDGSVSLIWLPDKWVGWSFGSREVQYWLSRWRPSWISNQNNFSYCWSSSHLDTSNCPFGSGEKVRNRFSKWLLGRPSWISDQNDFSYFFYLQVTPILPIKFRANGPFYSGEEVQNSFSRWQLWQPSCISDRNHLAILIYKSPRCFLPRFETIGLLVQKKRKICFQVHLRFPIGTILTIFDLQVTSMLPIKFRVNWPFGSEEEAKNRFSRWPSWISDRKKILAIFANYKSPRCFLPSFESIGLLVQEKKRQIDFQDGRHAILDFRSERF